MVKKKKEITLVLIVTFIVCLRENIMKQVKKKYTHSLVTDMRKKAVRLFFVIRLERSSLSDTLRMNEKMTTIDRGRGRGGGRGEELLSY